MMTVVLHGKLGERFPHAVTGNQWHLDAHSPAEALHAIDMNTGYKFFECIWELEKEMQGYHVQVGERTIGTKLLGFDFSNEVVTITPILQGADTKAIIEIVAGVALIAIGFATYGTSSFWGAELVLLGLGVALGGVSRFLMQSPTAPGLDAQNKTRASYVFSGVVNTVSQGECVPLAYGQPIIGSAVVAAGIEAQDVSTSP